MSSKIFLLKNLAFILLFSLILISCKENNEDPIDTHGDPPAITLSSETVSAYPGDEVSATVSITAPEGLKKLTVYNEATVLNEITFNFEKTVNYQFSYTIGSQITPGTIINIGLEAVDSLDRKSDKKIYQITVLEHAQKETIQVTSNISTNTTWTSDKFWRINGLIKVTNGTTLTIEPGTVIFGASDPKGSLLIEMGAKIIADGTSSAPIVFTSDKQPGARAAGDWGGVIICGKAPNNQGPSIGLEGDYGALHGGTIDNDNSGILRYVRIEYAGETMSSNKEKNSLTLASVGSGTIIENVQCSYSWDDAFEFFGGTVNAKNLVSYKSTDDDIDIDFGHKGNLQFVLIIRDAQIADENYSNGVEIDNDGAGTPLTPFSQTVMSNFTIIGGKYDANVNSDPLLQNAAAFRKNSMPTLYNSFLTGFPVGIFIDDTKPGVSLHALNEELQVRNVILAGVNGWGNNNWGGQTGSYNAPLRQIDLSVAQGFEVNTWFNAVLYNNRTLSKWQDAGIDQSIYTSNTPKVTPNTGSILLTAAKWDNTPKAQINFFEKVNFAGAVGTHDWTSGWCNWDPNVVVYQ